LAIQKSELRNQSHPLPATRRSTDKAASDAIFAYIREYFQETEFLFKNASQVRILDGQEEGIDAWISANYFNDKFKVSAFSVFF
jgi:hypothetical protein